MLKIYTASAGSGKTFTLVQEYLRQLLAYKNNAGKYELNKQQFNDIHSHLLALTFTNKATNEMKSKIIEQLVLLAEGSEDSDYAEGFRTEFICAPEELQKAAQKALKNILIDYQRFNVSTIDSFFQKVLRTFAREAEIDSNYNIELQEDGVYSAAISAMLHDININPNRPENQDLQNKIIAFAERQLQNDKGFNLFNPNTTLYLDLVNFIKHVTDEALSDKWDEMMNFLSTPHSLSNLRQAVENELNTTKEDCKKAAQKVLDLVKEANDSGKVKIDDSISKLFRSIVEETYNGGGGVALTGSKKEYYPYRKTDTRIADVDDAIEQGRAAIFAVSGMEKLLEVLSSNLFYLSLLKAIMKQVDQYRKENATQLIKDTNEILKKIIGDGDAPFVYERLGTQLRHYLIDEFQDTSCGQFANLLPLITEANSTDNDSLVIGDVKQSIYRWRNSDPRLLSNLPDVFEGKKKVFGSKPNENTNYRSLEVIVKFNNSLYLELVKKFSDNPDITKAYENLKQNVDPKKIGSGGYVKYCIYGKEKGTDPKEERNKLILRELKEYYRQGYKFGDVAILVRTNRTGMEIADFLRSCINDENPELRSLEIASDESLKLNDSPLVQAIIATLRYWVSPTVASKGKIGSRKDLTALLHDFEAGRAKGLTQSDALLEAAKKLTQEDAPFREEKPSNFKSPSDLMSIVEGVIRELVTPEDLASQGVYLIALKDRVKEFASHYNADVVSFLEWWDDNNDNFSVPSLPNPNAIAIMTVHKAKGLERPCVIVCLEGYTYYMPTSLTWFDLSPAFPHLNKKLFPPVVPLNMTKELMNTPLRDQFVAKKHEAELDTLNLAYVATTRAKRQMLILRPEKYKPNNSNSLNPLFSEVLPKDFETGERIGPKKDDDKKKTTVEERVLTLRHTALRDDLWKNTTVDSEVSTSEKEA